MKKRIWELDALRGLALIGVILIHLTFDLVYLFGVWKPNNLFLFDLGQDWGGVIFLVISGVCVTLGRHPVKRGILLFSCGMLITAVTAGMYFLGFADKYIIIYFGVLHCLGTCMLLWPLFQKCPTWLLAVLGVVLSMAGYYLVRNVSIDFPWLVPLGIPSHTFSSSDYFPLMPNLGYFLIGSVLGRTLYRNKQSLFPRVNTQNPVIRFLSFLGRQSLLVYLLHQPVLAAVIALFVYL